MTDNRTPECPRHTVRKPLDVFVRISALRGVASRRVLSAAKGRKKGMSTLSASASSAALRACAAQRAFLSASTAHGAARSAARFASPSPSPLPSALSSSAAAARADDEGSSEIERPADASAAKKCRSARAGVLASPRTARRGHVVEPAVRGRGCSRGRLRGVPLSAPSRAVGAGRPRLALRAPRPCDTPTTQPGEASGDRRPPPAAGGHEPRGCASRVPSVACPRPAWPGGERRPGSTFDSHSSRDCQQARRWCSSRLRPGTCRAAPQRPARFPADRRAQKRYDLKPAGGVSPSDPRRGEGRHSARRRRQRRRPAARGARRGPARTTKTHHPTAPLRTPPRASAHAPPRPLPGAGRSPYQPHECQLAIPPPRGEGERAD